jgi:glycosyltransferase involved in cell wall biosynthesis
MLASWDRKDRRVRIAFCEDRYHSFDLAQQNLVNLVTGLPVDSIVARVLTTKEGMFAARCRAAGAPCEVLPLADVANRYGGEVLRYGAADKLRTGIELGRYNFAFWRWLRRERIEVIVCNSARLSLALAGAAEAARVPLFVFLQGDGTAPWLKAASLTLCRRMLLIADSLRNEFTPALLRLHGHKLRTLNTGFSFKPLDVAAQRGRELRARWGLSESACVIGLVGSISQRKGADLLAAAAPRVLEAIPHARFVLVGIAPTNEAAFSRELERSVRRGGLEQYWIITGVQDDMAAVYGALDLCVLPSRAEGLPKDLIEALAYGVPCVATAVGGTRDAIQDPRFGRLVQPEDPEALAAAIVGLWRDEPRDGACAEARSVCTRTAFSIERYVATFLHIVRELVPRASFEPAGPTPQAPAKDPDEPEPRPGDSGIKGAVCNGKAANDT